MYYLLKDLKYVKRANERKIKNKTYTTAINIISYMLLFMNLEERKPIIVGVYFLG